MTADRGVSVAGQALRQTRWGGRHHGEPPPGVRGGAALAMRGEPRAACRASHPGSRVGPGLP